MVTWCMDALCFRVEHQKAHKGIGEIDLFGSVAIGHKTLKGVQRVYARLSHVTAAAWQNLTVWRV